MVFHEGLRVDGGNCDHIGFEIGEDFPFANTSREKPEKRFRLVKEDSAGYRAADLIRWPECPLDLPYCKGVRIRDASKVD
jgi:hypothetical protein